MSGDETKPRIGIISLGCANNLIDSEKILGVLGSAGFTICSEPEDAAVVIVNTCAFIGPARCESREAVEYALSLKRSGAIARVIVAGCMAQRYREKVLSDMPGVDMVLGIHDFESFPDLISSLFEGTPSKGETGASTFSLSPSVCADTGRMRITPRHYTYLRISEGCNNRCNYCVIPDIRGPLRSKPFDAVIGEAEELAADGAKEIIIVAQDTTSYGGELYETRRLPSLLRRIAAVDEVRWIRILYTHPAHYCDEFVEVFSDTPKLLPYLDMPVQHASDRILEKMGRGVKRRDLETLIKKLRGGIDDLVLRTSIIVGFPGETDRDVDELLDFLRTVRFDRLGAFPYSKERGTKAAGFSGHVSAEEKQERLDRVMMVQREISEEKNRLLIDKEVEAVIDSISGRYAAGRSFREAPEVDGVLHVKCDRKVAPGDFLKVRITDAGPYDLKAITV